MMEVKLELERNILKVEREVCGQDGLFEQLHEVAVLCGREVGEDIVTLRRHNNREQGDEEAAKHMSRLQYKELGNKRGAKALAG